jgi:hypothetical protein
MDDGSAQVKTSLPDSLWPAIVKGVELLLANSDAEGRLMVKPGEFGYRSWFDFAALALAYTAPAAGNPFRGDKRVADLIARAGRMLVDEHRPGGPINFDGWWWDSRPEEWTVESWLLAYELLCKAGSADLTDGWKECFLRVGETYDRYCRSTAGLRRMISPNLKISTNHFAYFAADLIRIGQVFDVPRFVEHGLETALKINSWQHPDGYWAESHGPTPSYNMITMSAIGLCHRYTGRAEFAESLARGVAFHTRFSYPDGHCLETIDQRVRYPSGKIFGLYALSDSPAGRGLAEICWRTFGPAMLTEAGRGMFGRLVYNYVHWNRGPAETPPCAGGDYFARLSDLPGGVVNRGPWVVALSGSPSRTRNHLFTYDRQNLLSIWHRECGLIIGGGNNRDNPQSATFYCRVPNDPTAIVHGITHEDVYVPADASLTIDASGGELDASYYGFDAKLAVRAIDERTCRITAFAGTLPVNDPVTLNLNVLVKSGEPLQTAAGPVALGDNAVELSSERLGGWAGQGRWRLIVPPGSRLSYPMIPFRCNPQTQALARLAVLTVPVTNRQAEVAVRVE